MDDAQKTAKRFIDLYDEVLKAQGIHTIIGIEQEFNLKQDLIDPMDRKASLRMARKAEAKFFSSPRRIADQLRRPVKSGPVNRFYPEYPEDASSPVEQYEITTEPSGPLQAAQRIEGFRDSLRSYVPGHPRHSKEKALWKVKELGFPAHKEDQGTYGMHINVSLQYKPPGAAKNVRPVYLMSPYCKDPRDLGLVTKHLSEGLKKLSESDILLCADTPQAFERFNGNRFFGTPHLISQGIKMKPTVKGDEDFNDPSFHRIEFRLPAGNSDPYLSTLMVMAAVYEQFANMKPEAGNDEKNWVTYGNSFSERLRTAVHEDVNNKLCQDMSEARKRFRTQSRAVASMKTIAQQFGTPEDQASAERFTSDMISHTRLRQIFDTKSADFAAQIRR